MSSQVDSHTHALPMHIHPCKAITGLLLISKGHFANPACEVTTKTMVPIEGAPIRDKAIMPP